VVLRVRGSTGSLGELTNVRHRDGLGDRGHIFLLAVDFDDGENRSDHP